MVIFYKILPFEANLGSDEHFVETTEMRQYLLCYAISSIIF